MTNKEFGVLLFNAMRDGQKKFLPETPTYRWLPIEHPVMLAQQAYKLRRYPLEHNDGRPIRTRGRVKSALSAVFGR